MIKLYDNAFSPFARKVRLALNYKGIPFTSVDALTHHDRQEFKSIYPRAEVPLLIDDNIQVANSADILAYLEDRYPQKPIFPQDPALRVRVRHWQRVADTLFDAILHDISIWMWPMLKREDTPPEGLWDVATADIERILTAWDQALGKNSFLCGEVSAADFALFPHIAALKILGIVIDPEKHAPTLNWLRALRELPCVAADREFAKSILTKNFSSGKDHPYEARKIFWRGDRIEWLFHHGFQKWWQKEWDDGRAAIPATLL